MREPFILAFVDTAEKVFGDVLARVFGSSKKELVGDVKFFWVEYKFLGKEKSQSNKRGRKGVWEKGGEGQEGK